jgi:hypothetical protein
MEKKMNNIGIDDNLNRNRIRKLLIIGLIASIITGIGDFILGYAIENEGTNFVTNVMFSTSNLADSQLILGSLLGLFGLFIEGLSLFSIYRLMADRSPKYAHIYRTGIFGYIWLVPIGCHLNMGLLKFVYKYFLEMNPSRAEELAKPLFYGFCLPVYILLICFCLPMIIVQIKAFRKGYTPYPKFAWIFNTLIGSIPALVIGLLIGTDIAIGHAIGTTFLSVGNAFMFLGLLLLLPSEEKFNEYKSKYKIT